MERIWNTNKDYRGTIPGSFDYSIDIYPGMSLSCRDPVVLFQTHKTYAPANYDIISPDCVLFEAIMLINYDIVSGILRKTFCGIWNEIQHFFIQENEFEHSSEKRWPLCFGLNFLIWI